MRFEVKLSPQAKKDQVNKKKKNLSSHVITRCDKFEQYTVDPMYSQKMSERD